MYLASTQQVVVPKIDKHRQNLTSTEDLLMVPKHVRHTQVAPPFLNHLSSQNSFSLEPWKQCRDEPWNNYKTSLSEKNWRFEGHGPNRLTMDTEREGVLDPPLPSLVRALALPPRRQSCQPKSTGAKIMRCFTTIEIKNTAKSACLYKTLLSLLMFFNGIMRRRYI